MPRSQAPSELPSELGSFSHEENVKLTSEIARASNRGQLEHKNFAVLLAKCKLEKTYRIDDPECEICLETAELEGQLSVNAALQRLHKRAICCDTFVQSHGIPKRASERKKELKKQLDACKGEYSESTAAYNRKVVKKYGEENIKYLVDRGLERDDAEGCVWALSFYTGEGSQKSSRGASLMVRKGNQVDTGDGTEDDPAVQEVMERTRTIIWFIVRALSCLPFYWGTVVRHLTLGDSDAALYSPGNIVTWLQFSSSRKGTEGSGTFSGRNAKFVIWSMKGRQVDRFSNFRTDILKEEGKDESTLEDEVLFLPFTRLLILSCECKGNNYMIHARELELGLTEGLPLMWVDDHILDADFEMKSLMEHAQVARQQEIKFILKPSTRLAVAFLRSTFGQFHHDGHTKFRIMSDMSRPKEEDGDRAGATLVNRLGGFTCPVMIFTSNAERGRQKLNEAGVVRKSMIQSGIAKAESNVIQVTDKSHAASQFCCFKDV